MSSQRANNTLHGVTLEAILTRLVQHYGWVELGRIVKIKCFTQGPSIKSSLTFLRRAPWAREMVEHLYVRTPLAAAVNAGVLVVDDRSSSDYHSNLGTTWRVVTDTVMGGVSQGRLVPDTVEGRPCLRLSGEVSLENNGGFIQAALDLGTDALLDASAYAGLELDVCGNGESYNVHLRTSDTRMVWQSYRAGFSALLHWDTVRLPFAGFQPHRLDTPLDLRRLKRIGIVAIGRAFTADLCVGRVALYRLVEGS